MLPRQYRHKPWWAKDPDSRYCIQWSVAVATTRRMVPTQAQKRPPLMKLYMVICGEGERWGQELDSWVLLVLEEERAGGLGSWVLEKEGL